MSSKRIAYDHWVIEGCSKYYFNLEHSFVHMCEGKWDAEDIPHKHATLSRSYLKFNGRCFNCDTPILIEDIELLRNHMHEIHNQ